MDEKKVNSQNQSMKRELGEGEWYGECLPYATGLYADATGITSSNNANAKEYWNNSTSSERKMHVCAPSVPIWFNGVNGHAGFISAIDDDGTIHFQDANYKFDGIVHHVTFSDPYDLGQRCRNFKGYVQRETSRVD